MALQQRKIHGTHEEALAHNHNSQQSRSVQSSSRKSGSDANRASKPAQRKVPKCGVFIGPGADTRSEAAGGKPARGDTHNRFINRQITRAAEAGDVGMLFESISTHIADMNGINLATAFHRVAKLSNTHSKQQAVKNHLVFQRLIADITQHISRHRGLHHAGANPGTGTVAGEMPVQCLSIVAWSCATLRIRDEDLFSQIATIAELNLGELKSYELSNLLWAYAKMHLAAPGLYTAAVEKLMHRKDGEFKVQCLSTIAWCFATMQWRNAPIFNSLAEELVANPWEAKPQEISTTLWAFAKNRHTNAALFEVFAQVMLQGNKIKGFKLQELSNTAWSFATLGLQNTQLFEAIERAVLSKLPDMEPQSIANIMWAFAKAQVPMKTSLFPTLLNLTVTGHENFKPQELSALIWATSQSCPSNAEFFGATMSICAKRLKHFSPNAVSNLVKTFSGVMTTDPGQLLVILQANLERLPQLLPQALCNALHGAVLAAAAPAYAEHAHALRSAASCIGVHLASRLHELKNSEIEHLSCFLKKHKKCFIQPSIHVLEKGLAARSFGKSPQDDAELLKSSTCDASPYGDEDDLDWPMSGAFSMRSGSSRASYAWSTATTAASERELNIREVPEKIKLASALADPAPLSGLGDTLSSLAKGLPSAGYTFGSMLPPATPDYGLDSMPWKVPMPCDDNAFVENPKHVFAHSTRTHMLSLAGLVGSVDSF